METTEKNQIKVGIFVIVGLFIVLGSILLLGGDRLFLVKKADLYAEFDQVQGLATGSVVSIAGVTIGNIRKIQFIPAENKLRVQMRIDANYLQQITDGSTAEIRTQGALGDKYIYIQPGDPKSKSLEAGATLPMKKSTDILGVISEHGKEADKIFEIVKETHKLLKTVNNDNRVDQILENLREASRGLKISANESEKLLGELRIQSSSKIKTSIEKLDRILTKIDKGEGSLGALINDPSLHESLKNMLGSSERKKNIKSLIRSSIDGSTDSSFEKEK